MLKTKLQRRYYICFDVACIKVIDKCSDILKLLQMDIDQREIGDKGILEFRDQIISVKALARNVFRSTLKNNRVALFPWSFTSIKELGCLTNEQIDSVLTICPLTSHQQAKIRLGYRDLWKQGDRQAKQKYSAEQLTIATLKKNHEVR